MYLPLVNHGYIYQELNKNDFILILSVQYLRKWNVQCIQRSGINSQLNP